MVSKHPPAYSSGFFEHRAMQSSLHEAKGNVGSRPATPPIAFSPRVGAPHVPSRDGFNQNTHALGQTQSGFSRQNPGRQPFKSKISRLQPIYETQTLHRFVQREARRTIEHVGAPNEPVPPGTFVSVSPTARTGQNHSRENQRNIITTTAGHRNLPTHFVEYSRANPKNLPDLIPVERYEFPKSCRGMDSAGRCQRLFSGSFRIFTGDLYEDGKRENIVI
ncbi:hypothetical protein [Ranid herpesvirus 3]|uniref:Uncharacterized protein n=1 Tax=Ranid herpesvirus 3 TaxID=1987509 RepID=A0A1X9T567_9VIRU|nr:hypothetical protein [Ranid herpesvirus 3]ARR28843.1 hypothetical protein [Ranid herpesvirus 3]